MKHFNIPIFIPHLGCPYDCIYCDQRKISAQLQAPEDAEVIAIINQHLLTIPASAEVELAFFGGNFTAIPLRQQEHYLNLIQPYLKSGRIEGIRISTRPDCISENELLMLKQYNVKTIELGVQSLNDEVLHLSARKYNKEEVTKSAHLIKKHGFRLGFQLMIGLPGDSYERDIETVKETIRVGPQMARIYPTLVIAGTQLEHMWAAGKYKALDLEEAILISKDMLLYFEAAKIPVIRMGLYPGEELRNKEVVKAGPFHPAFKELVEQAIFKDQASLALQTFFAIHANEKNICIHVQERDLSKMLGKNRSNLSRLCDSFQLQNIEIKTSPSDQRNWVGISKAGADIELFRLSREEYINKKGFNGF